MSASTLHQLIQSALGYPTPEDEEERSALLEWIKPEITAIAAFLCQGDEVALLSGCKEVMTALGADGSPYISYFGSTQLPAQRVSLPVRNELLRAIRSQPGYKAKTDLPLKAFMAGIMDYQAPVNKTSSASVEEIILKTLNNRRPGDEKSMKALLEKLRPDFEMLAQLIMARGRSGIKRGCYEILEAYSSPASPFYVNYTPGSPAAFHVASSVKRALASAFREQPGFTRENLDEVASILSGADIYKTPIAVRKASPNPQQGS